MDWVPEIIREGMLTAIFISGPLVILAAALGLIVGILQAATQVQEQTLGSAVKILGVFLALIIGGFYIFSYLKKYTERNIVRAFQLIPTLEPHPMPRKNYFTPVNKKDSKLSGLPEALDMKKPKAAPPKVPSKLKARDMATGPETVRGTPSKTIPALGKPPSQVPPPKQGLNDQSIGNKQRPANSAPANNQAQRPAITNNRNTPATGGRPNTPATGARPATPVAAVRPNTPAAGTRPTTPVQQRQASGRPRLTPELVDTNTNQQAAPVQTATPTTVPVTAPTPADSQFSSAIEKLKENAQQGDTQP
ncbi:MAG: flagellar biosynthetic protein FliQ [Cyanobacteria bacterium REEB446]|nr:flagellar biosynthetic protein FliQ [Cyanobacteria bacterium REEB446]